MARMPDEFYYGFEPPEPEPVGECFYCGEEVYSDDCTINGELSCMSCRELFDSDKLVMDFAQTYQGSWMWFLREHYDQPWAEQMIQAAREYFYEDLATYLQIKNETPCCNTTPQRERKI